MAGGAAGEWALIAEAVACRNFKALVPGRSLASLLPLSDLGSPGCVRGRGRGRGRARTRARERVRVRVCFCVCVRT